MKIFGVHIPEKDPPPPKHIQEEKMLKARIKRERQFMRNKYQRLHIETVD